MSFVQLVVNGHFWCGYQMIIIYISMFVMTYFLFIIANWGLSDFNKVLFIYLFITTCALCSKTYDIAFVWNRLKFNLFSQKILILLNSCGQYSVHCIKKNKNSLNILLNIYVCVAQRKLYFTVTLLQVICSYHSNNFKLCKLKKTRTL